MSAEALQAELVVVLPVELRPQRVEAPFAPLAAMADAADQELDRGQHDLLEGAAGAEVDAEGDVEGEEIEAEEARDRPEAEHQEGDARRRPWRGSRASSRCGSRCGSSERCGRITAAKTGRSAVGGVEAKPCRCPCREYNAPMPVRKPTRRHSREGRRRSPRRSSSTPLTAAGEAGARAAPAEAGRPGDRRRGLPPLPRREPGAEGRARARQPLHAARRRRALGPVDRRRRQQGDARALSRSPTRRRRCWRSARTACASTSGPSNFFNTKARNVIALSRRLVEEHGGEVPPSIEVLQTLPGRRAQERERRRQHRLRRAARSPSTPTSSGSRTASRWSRTETPLETQERLERIVPDEFRLHAHHWLILHGRYVCKARRPSATAA